MHLYYVVGNHIHGDKDLSLQNEYPRASIPCRGPTRELNPRPNPRTSLRSVELENKMRRLMTQVMAVWTQDPAFVSDDERRAVE